MRLLSLILLLTGLALTRSFADGLDRWNQTLELPVPPSFVTYGSGVYAGLIGGQLVLSTNAINWSRPSGTESWGFSHLLFEKGFFIATVALPSGGSAIMTSTNGATWIERLRFSGYVDGFFYVNGRFVVSYWAVRFDLEGFTSLDGISWKRTPDEFDLPFHANFSMYGIGYLVYENGVYAAASLGYKTSPDGTHWTSAPGFSSALLAYGNGVVVSLGSNDSWNDPVLIGRDLADPSSWERLPNAFHLMGTATALSFIKDKFILLTSVGGIYISTNGRYWKKPKSGTTASLSSVTSDGTNLVVGGAAILSSSDGGETWTELMPKLSAPQAVLELTNRVVVFGTASEGEGAMWISEEGLPWIRKKADTPYINGVLATPQGLVAWPGPYVSTTESQGSGWTWTRAPIKTLTPWYPQVQALVAGPQGFIGVGASITNPPEGRIFTSSDAISWTERAPFPSMPELHSIAYGNGTYVAGSEDGRLWTSPDGLNWTRRDAAAPTPIVATVFGNGTFLAAASGFAPAGLTGSTLFSSENGTNWLQTAQFFDFFITSVAYGNGTFVAVANPLPNGIAPRTIFSSPDGFTWTRRPTPIGERINLVSFARNRFYLLTATAIYESDPVIPHDPLRFISLGKSPAGGFRFTIEGQPGAAVEVMSTTDLRNWSKLTVLPNPVGHATFTIPADGPRQFYGITR